MHIRCFTSIFAALLLSVAFNANAAQEQNERFPKIVPSGFGINVNTFAGFPATLDPVREGGFKVVRTAIYWTHVEKEKGKFDWNEYDRFMKQLVDAGIRPLIALHSSNPLYEPTEKTGDDKKPMRTYSPVSPRGVEGFARFAAGTAQKYKGHNVIWEIWNEPDYEHFWYPKPNGNDYAKMALATCEAIKKADPSAIVVGPSASGTPSEDDKKDWWLAFLKSPAPNCFDAISLHPYVRGAHKGPEINIEKYARLRSLLAEYGVRKLPLISTEFGFTTTDKNISENRQAALFVRNYMVNLMENVSISIWYDWYDDGNDPKERENRFGIMKRDMEPKPAYLAAQTLYHQLDGYSYEKRVLFEGQSVNSREARALRNEEDFVLLFVHPTKPPMLVVWTTSASLQKVEIPLSQFSTTSVAITDMLGNKGELGKVSMSLVMEFREEPQYISLYP